jgi:hypothetical protein
VVGYFHPHLVHFLRHTSTPPLRRQSDGRSSTPIRTSSASWRTINVISRTARNTNAVVIARRARPFTFPPNLTDFATSSTTPGPAISSN